MVKQESHHGHLMSKFVGCTWRARKGLLLPEMIGSRLGCFESKAVCSYRQQPKATPIGTRQPKQHRKPSAPWVCFARKLGLLNCASGCKVQALHSDWLNYDSQSYALNFEKDIVLESDDQYRSKAIAHMPTISGPGAREIIAVLLRRSSSTNRNCGSHLIPKPVFFYKHQRSHPQLLWKRRTGQEPPRLDIHGRHSVRP